jgi:Flp pilus assembly protein TadB
MIIVITFLAAFYIGLFYGVYQDKQKSIARKQEKQLARINRKREIEREELKQLDFNERLETMENETVYLLNRIANEKDSNKVIKLHKELQRVQKQRYITKYKEDS